MIAVQAILDGILCGGSNPVKATFICVHDGCTSYAMMCSNLDCQCYIGHSNHNRRPVSELATAISVQPSLPASYQKSERMINNFIDSGLRLFGELRQNHDEHVKEQLVGINKHRQLRQKLINHEPLDRSTTGHAVCELLKESSQQLKVDNPYLFTSPEIEGKLREWTNQIEKIRLATKGLWKQEYLKRQVIVKDLQTLPSYIKAISFASCTSKEWRGIGIRLASLPALETLTVKDCDSGKQLCSELRASKSLKLLTMRDCRINDEGVQFLCEISQLEELRLSPLEEPTNNPNQLTISGFTAVLESLRILPKLAVLEMSLPVERDLFSADMSIGDRGAEFVACNLPNLTTLYLSNNNVTDKGAKAIVNRLRNLTTLYISNNNITDDGAKAIADGLRQLTTLAIDKTLSEDCKKHLKESLPNADIEFW